MYLIHVHGHQNSGIPASTLTPIASLNIRLDELVEQIMEAFILSSVKINTRMIGISDLHIMSSVFIHRSPIHPKITQYIA